MNTSTARTKASQMQTDPPGCTTVYYDGSCPLCTREVSVYRTAQNAEALHFVDVSQAQAQLAPDLTRAEAMARFHVRRADGELQGGAAAFATLWRALPRFRRLGKLLEHRLVLPLAECVYRAFLVVRPLMQKAAARLLD